MAKRNSFELAVYKKIRRELRRKGLGLRPEVCQVHYHKSYFSKDRGRNIVVDISVELYLPGASKPLLIWVWECKDYTYPVPVSDVEEFHAKIQQIGEDNTKGTLIVNGIIQKSALNYAISKGIGIARWMPEDEIEWVSYHNDEEPCIEEETRRALCDANFVAVNRRFFVINSTGRAESWGDFEIFFLKELKFSGMHQFDLWRKKGPGLDWDFIEFGPTTFG